MLLLKSTDSRSGLGADAVPAQKMARTSRRPTMWTARRGLGDQGAQVIAASRVREVTVCRKAPSSTKTPSVYQTEQFAAEADRSPFNALGSG